MSEFKDKIDKICVFFEKQKANQYPIRNAVLLQEDEESRCIYLKVLCSIAQYMDEPDRMQDMFLKRLIAGANVNKKFEEFLDELVELDEGTITDFMTKFRGKEAALTFVTDAMILIGVISPYDEGQMVYVSELIELLGLKKNQVEYLSKVASSILGQTSMKFELIQNLRPMSVSNIIFKHYMQEFYSGILVNEMELKYYYSFESAPLKNKVEGVMTTNTVIFENLQIPVETLWKFDGCEEVRFINCELKGSSFYLKFNSVGKVIFENCKFLKFENRVAKLYSVNHFIVKDSVFSECGYLCEEEGKGGLFDLNGNGIKEIVFETSRFMNCYIEAKKNHEYLGVTGVIMGGNGKTTDKLQVKNCKFIGCQCKKHSKYTPALIIDLIYEHLDATNNEFYGGVQDLCL